jgi:pyridoxamine 5'-phosphate oxidase
MASESSEVKPGDMLLTGLDDPSPLQGVSAATHDPFALFATWYALAQRSELTEANAMALSTVSPAGRPSVRMVLLKEVTPDGFTFYTNYESRKGGELLSTRFASLCFHWKTLGRQVRVEGRAVPVDPSVADAYWATRGRESQLGAWASQQSRELPSRDVFLARIAALEAEHPPGSPVPRPPHWSGFTVVPESIEFWVSLPGRWHDRIVFSRCVEGDDATASDEGQSGAAAWSTVRLYP